MVSGQFYTSCRRQFVRRFFFFFYLILVLKSYNVFAWQMCSLYTGIIIIRNKTKCLEQSSCCLTKMCSFGKHHNSLVFRAENARVSGL